MKFKVLCASNSRTNEGKEKTETKKINYLILTVTLLHTFDCSQSTGAFKDKIRCKVCYDKVENPVLLEKAIFKN